MTQSATAVAVQCGTTIPGTNETLNQQNVTTALSAAMNETGVPMWLMFHCDHSPGDIPAWWYALCTPGKGDA